MLLNQVVLLIVVALLASSNCLAKNEVSTSTAANVRNLLSFEDANAEFKSTKEERVSAGAKAAAEGGRTGAGDTVVSTSNDGGGTVTVTIFSNNGLWQRIKRWWLNLFANEERASSGGITSGEGGRAGAGGTVVSSGNGNGGGTITVTIFNNNGLFQRIVGWWKSLWNRKVVPAKSTTDSTRLRQ
ncbi:hypothetical protein P3T76_005973 [Phytophthora citrophthora]|uniref:RxLR effector protein n=1 Tax=Phytophthora citrophthora TaxID=4793 RepID=A0AAD9LPV1_9STRA|nr:hypothetical protein P3T76_005973 [Phytophthora citrophthora]